MPGHRLMKQAMPHWLKLAGVRISVEPDFASVTNLNDLRVEHTLARIRRAGTSLGSLRARQGQALPGGEREAVPESVR